MSAHDYFARVDGSVNFPLLQGKQIVIVGAGMVGSQIAVELANCGVGQLRLIDHDVLERPNLPRHALNDDYLGWNKAEALAVYLAQHVPGMRAESMPKQIDPSVPDELVDQWLKGADLIVAATDDHRAQRRIGHHALDLGIITVFPALYLEGGGEIIVQFDDQLPCFSCWDVFREDDAPLRDAQALNVIALPVLYISLRICLGLLDPSAPERELLRAGGGRPPYQTFGLNRFGTLLSGFLKRRPDCPVCRGGTSGLTPGGNSATEPLPKWPAPPRRPPRMRPPQAAPAPLLDRLGALAVALAFAAAPVGVMAVFAPIFNSHQHNIGVDLIGLIVGPGCVFWLVFGIARFFRAVGKLFSDW
jgi:hypothetical protein